MRLRPGAARRWLRWRSHGPYAIHVTTALIGASRWSQIEDSLGALDNLAFAEEELAQIDEFAVDSGINLWAT